MMNNQNIEETGILKDSQLDQENGGLKEVDGEVQLSAGDLSNPEASQAKNVKPEGKGQNMWDKAKETAGEAAAEIKDAINPNSGDPATNKDYR